MNSKIMQEEIFGPLLPVLKYKDVNTVIKHIKENEKPLTLYIFARNQRLINRYVCAVLVFAGLLLLCTTVISTHIPCDCAGVDESNIHTTHMTAVKLVSYTFTFNTQTLTKTD